MRISESTIKQIINEEFHRVLSEAAASFSVVDGKLIVNGIKTKITIKAVGKVFNDVKVDAASLNPDGSANISLDAGGMKADKKIKNPQKVKQIIDSISAGKTFTDGNIAGSYEIAPSV